MSHLQDPFKERRRPEPWPVTARILWDVFYTLATISLIIMSSPLILACALGGWVVEWKGRNDPWPPKF